MFLALISQSEVTFMLNNIMITCNEVLFESSDVESHGYGFTHRTLTSAAG